MTTPEPLPPPAAVQLMSEPDESLELALIESALTKQREASHQGPDPMIDTRSKEEIDAHMERVIEVYQSPGRWAAIKVVILAAKLESAVHALLKEHQAKCDCCFCANQREHSTYAAAWRKKMLAMAVTVQCIREAIECDSDHSISSRYTPA